MIKTQSKVQKALYSHDLKRVYSLVMLFLIITLSFSHPLKAAKIPDDIKPAGDLTLPELKIMNATKEEMELKDFTGPLTIVHFWATWCAPCVTELPTLNKFADQYRSQGVSFIVVSLDNSDKPEIIKAFYQKYKITSLPIFFARQSDVLRHVNLVGLPTTLFVKDGVIVGRADADVHWETKEVADYVEQLVTGN